MHPFTTACSHSNSKSHTQKASLACSPTRTSIPLMPMPHRIPKSGAGSSGGGSSADSNKEFVKDVVGRDISMLKAITGAGQAEKVHVITDREAVAAAAQHSGTCSLKNIKAACDAVFKPGSYTYQCAHEAMAGAFPELHAGDGGLLLWQFMASLICSMAIHPSGGPSGGGGQAGPGQVQMIEYMAGRAEVSNAILRYGMNVRSFDIKYSASHDCLKPSGFRRWILSMFN